MKRTLLSVNEIAFVMGASTQSIRRSYWKGDFPAFRVSNMLRFDLKHVLEISLANGLPGNRPARVTHRATVGESRWRPKRTRPRSVRRRLWIHKQAVLQSTVFEAAVPSGALRSPLPSRHVVTSQIMLGASTGVAWKARALDLVSRWSTAPR